MKKLLSVVLALLMLAVMLPVTAMAAGNPTKENGVWKNVDPNNVQALLDGVYGSINETTIELSAGDYDKIEFGRATAYEDSDTKYYLNDSETTVDAIKQAIAAHPQGGAGTPVYVRSMSNVTLKAADGAAVTINGLVAFGGQVNSTKWYSKDFVADRVAKDNNTSYYINQKWNNITFEGLTFTGGVNIEAYEGNTFIDNVKFENCKFSITDNPSKTYCIRLNVDGNIAQANNLVVNKCEFTNGNTAVLTDGMPNVTVTDSTFSGLARHAINQMMNYLPKAPGYGEITVTGNTFKNMSNAEKGTILRMGEVGAGAVLTIKNNTATEGITLANSVKVNSLADSGITYDISGNNWGENLKFSEEFKNIVDEPIPKPSTPIVIVPSTEETPKPAEDQKNPSTGANDMVAAAVALMAVSALGMAVLSRKK